jgi:hypothetical protein
MPKRIQKDTRRMILDQPCAHPRSAPGPDHDVKLTRMTNMQGFILKTLCAMCLTAVVLVPRSAHPQTTPTACETMVATTEAAQRRVVLRAEVNQADDTVRLSFAVDPGSRHAIDGRFLDINRHTTRAGRNRVSREHLRCVDNTLVLDQLEWIEGRPGAETYEPPLTWLTWPIEPDAEWSWSGRLVLSDVVPPMPGEATFLVEQTVELSVLGRAWRLAAVTMRLEVTARPNAAPEVVRVTTVYVVEPWYAVLHRERWLGDESIEPVQRFVPEYE